jgi:uncharacterized membrane protein YagU involved in acid resistance
MSWASWLVWGFAATAALTTLMAGSEGVGLTRMNIPHMLGTMFTSNRDRAKVYGALLHFLNGWAFSIVYVAAFHTAHRFTWWFGALLGILHGAFVAAVVLPVLPGVHPRMASELRGPTVARQLEPPGFLALNYGARTPISVLIAHIVFGAMLGGLYRPTGIPRYPPASAQQQPVDEPDRGAQQGQDGHDRRGQRQLVPPFAPDPPADVGWRRPELAARLDGHRGVFQRAQEFAGAPLVVDRHVDAHRRHVLRHSDQRAAGAPETRRDPLVAQQLGQHLALGWIGRAVDGDVAPLPAPAHRPCSAACAVCAASRAPSCCFCTFPIALRGSAGTSSSARGSL